MEKRGNISRACVVFRFLCICGDTSSLSVWDESGVLKVFLLRDIAGDEI